VTLFAGLSLVSLCLWIGLLAFRGGFWKADQRFETAESQEPDAWPSVTAIVPARNEARTIGMTVSAILEQDYPGEVSVIVIDDHSSDGTADEVCDAAAGDERLRVIPAADLPAGWAGKVWAMSQGVDFADGACLWFTDAEIVHQPYVLRGLVSLAAAKNTVLTSQMVMLRCNTFWERLLIPAFIFFFQKLYPFGWVNDPANRSAGAAGGSMLLRDSALLAAGGLEKIKGEIIDDCALARLLKPQGAIWLGLTTSSHSLRDYTALGEIWTMVSRTAFNQLNYSFLKLVGTLIGMAILYMWPVVAVAAGKEPAIWGPGLAAWALMSLAYAPTLRFYGLPVVTAPVLPVAALLYTLMTMDSALRHWAGRDTAWKGRSYGEETRETDA
jgi:hopene-associated glycosyltransferase HpnB